MILQVLTDDGSPDSDGKLMPVSIKYKNDWDIFLVIRSVALFHKDWNLLIMTG